MESYEKKSEQGEAQAERLEDRGDEVDRRIEETKSDWQSKQGSVPGMETGAQGATPAEAEDDRDEPNATSVD